MKHPFIILGTAGALLMLGGAVWVYLFLFYEPAPEQTRTADNPFVEVDSEAFSTREANISEEEVGETLPTAARGITERRVAGIVGLNDGYRIIEAGTGHAYEITFAGAERKISNTTLPQAVEAVWAPTGERVAVMRDIDGVYRTFVMTVGDEEGAVEIPGVIHNIAWSEDAREMFYTRAVQSGSEGVSRTIDTDEERVVFTTPLRDIVVLWGTNPLIITKASNAYVGYAYRTDHSRAADPLPGLMGVAQEDIQLFSGVSGAGLVSWFVRGADIVPIARGVIPEKCALVGDGAVCASPKRFDASTYPDAWYRGEELYDDELFSIDARTGETEPLGDLAVPYRTPLDIVRADAAPGGAVMRSRDGRVVFVEIEN
jgi:hypothetical protein